MLKERGVGTSAVFLFEQLGDKEAGCVLARNAFNSALADVDTLSLDDFQATTTVLQVESERHAHTPLVTPPSPRVPL